MKVSLEEPHGWTRFTLGELLELSNGVNADKAAYGRGIPFVNVLEVITHEGLSEALIPGRITLPADVAARYEVKYGDLLFNRTSETPDEVGLAAVYLDQAAMVFGGFVIRGRPTTTHLDVGYSKYVLRDPEVRKQIVARGQGGIRANIGQRDLKGVVVTLPPLDEQRAIAAVLDDADQLIASLEELLSKKQAIKQGLVRELLGADAARPWRRVRLGDVASMGSGGTPDSKIARYYGGGIPWVSISDITRSGKYVRSTEKTLSQEGLTNSAARLYDANAVLYAMYASLGECALAVGPMASSQAILGIVPGREIDREFLYYCLAARKAQVREMGQQGTQSNLNAGMVRDFAVDIPSLDEQRWIARVLADTDADLDAVRERLTKARAIKSGLMQELLGGRTRLPAASRAAEAVPA